MFKGIKHLVFGNKAEKTPAEKKAPAVNVQEQLEREQASEIARICYEGGDLMLAVPLLESGATPEDAKALIAEREAENAERDRKVDDALGTAVDQGGSAAGWDEVVSKMHRNTEEGLPDDES